MIKNIRYKWKIIINAILNRLNLFIYLPELIKPSKVWVRYAIPRWKKNNYNWGDDINSQLINLISSKTVIPYQYSWFSKTHYLCIGSILQWYTKKNSIIWGSGLLYPVKTLTKPQKVLAVRGPLTRKVLLDCKIDCPEIYGDPVLLLPRYYMPKIKKKYKFGVICHITELNRVKNLLSLNEDFLFINIRSYGKWYNLIDQVLSCQMILSSSLHGIIVSDAYNIPNLWCKFTDYIAEHEGFKFRDYYLSVGKNITYPYQFRDKNVSQIEMEIKKTWTKPIINLDKLLKVCPFLN